MDFTGGNGQGQEQMFFRNVFPFRPPSFFSMFHTSNTFGSHRKALICTSIFVPCNV